MDKKYIKITILLISSLTIMAGAGVAPVLGFIKAAFVDANELLIKMIIALPPFFIILTSFIFPFIAKKFNIKQIGLIGIVLYLIGGVGGGFMPNINLVLFFRAILGVGTGLLMPLSVGLIFLLLEKEEHPNFMGLQGFFNNLGGFVAFGLSGFLGSFDYRLGFLVYLMAVVVGFFILVYLPQQSFHQKQSAILSQTIQKISILLLCAFLSMAIFYILPSNFSLVATKKAIFDKAYFGIILGLSSVGGMISGLLFKKLVDGFKNILPFFGIFLYMISLMLLSDFRNIFTVGCGIFMVGFSLGIFMPFIVFKIGQKVQKNELSIAMGFASSFIFLGQFGSSFLVKIIENFLHIKNSFMAGIVLSLLLTLLFLLENKKR